MTRSGMPKQSRNLDPAHNALPVVELATGGALKPKNPAAVALGILGGRKGGKARAEALGPKKLSKIGKEMAKKRWAAVRDRNEHGNG